MVVIIPIPALNDNYIWLIHDGRHAVAVDAGEAPPVEEALHRLKLSLHAVLSTHHHADHVGGNAALAAAHAGLAVYGSAGENIPARTVSLVGGERFVLPGVGLECEVMAVPGHTLGHLAYRVHLPEAEAVFVGDTLFAAGCGRIFEGTPAMMWSSLSALAVLPPLTRVYCGHEYTLSNLRFARAVEPGNPALARREARVKAWRNAGMPSLPTTLADELTTNPFLRTAEPSVQQAAREHSGGQSCVTPGETFAVLRAWKDGFR